MSLSNHTRWRKFIRPLLIGGSLGIGVFFAILILSDFSQLLQNAMYFPWLILLPVIGLRVINWGVRFLKWHFYLWLVGVRSLSLTDSAAVFVSGFPMSISPGKAAEFLKCLILFHLTRAPIAQTIPVVASERFSDGMAVLVLIAAAIVGLSAHEYWGIVILCAALFGIGIIILQVRPLCMALLRLLARIPLIGRYAHTFEVFYAASYQIVLLPNLAIAVGMGVIANLLDALGVYLILVGMGLPPTLETFLQAMLVDSLAVVAGAISGMPGAIGAADLTITGSLQGLVGLSVAGAGFATLVIRFVQLWLGVFVGLGVIFFARHRLLPATVFEAAAQHQVGEGEIQSEHPPVSVPVQVFSASPD